MLRLEDRIENFETRVKERHSEDGGVENEKR